MIANTIRTSGDEGEELLIKLMKFQKNEKVRMAAASVLSYRLPVDPNHIDLQLVLEQTTLFLEDRLVHKF